MTSFSFECSGLGLAWIARSVWVGLPAWIDILRYNFVFVILGCRLLTWVVDVFRQSRRLSSDDARRYAFSNVYCYVFFRLHLLRRLRVVFFAGVFCRHA